MPSKTPQLVIQSLQIFPFSGLGTVFDVMITRLPGFGKGMIPRIPPDLSHVLVAAQVFCLMITRLPEAGKWVIP